MIGAQLKPVSFHWGIMLTTVTIGVLGLINLSSASQSAEGNLTLLQGIWFFVGILIVIVLALINYRFLEKFAYPIFMVTLITLLLVLVIGRVISGSQRWIALGVINFQPSEFAKIGLILALAKYFGEELLWPNKGYTILRLFNPTSVLYPVGAMGVVILFWEYLPIGHWKFAALLGVLIWGGAVFVYAIRMGIWSFHEQLSPVILILLPMILIMKQPDLGTALTLMAIGGSIIPFVRVHWISLVIVLGLGITIFVGLLIAASSDSLDFLEEHQKRRVITFFYPEKATKDDKHQSYQSEIAVGSGGFAGKGYGQSTQTEFKYLPEHHTDFAFSVWAEETGFMGCLLVILLSWFWIAQMISALSTVRDKFGVLVGVGVVSMIFWQTLVNIGMVIGFMPVVGMTLPLWSYGGSSMLSILIGVGLVLSVHYRRHTSGQLLT